MATLLAGPSCLPTNGEVTLVVVGVSSSITLFQSPEISIDVDVTPDRTAKFKALKGDLTIGGVVTPYRLAGIATGDKLSKGVPTHITILVSPSLTQLARGSASLFSGGVEIAFDGTLSVSKFGIPFSLLVDFSKSISLGKDANFSETKE
jgi:hypothetical protein